MKGMTEPAGGTVARQKLAEAIQNVLSSTDVAYTHILIHPEWYDAMREDRYGWYPLGQPAQFYGYRVEPSDAVPMGTVVFHSPHCAGTYRVTI